MLGLAGVGLLVEWVLPPPKSVIEGLRQVITPAQGKSGFAFALLLTAVTPAICEEALFRGPILRGLRTRLSAARRRGADRSAVRPLPRRASGASSPPPRSALRCPSIALAADSIVPAMVAHFANNAIIIALASAGMDEADTTMSVQQRLPDRDLARSPAARGRRAARPVSPPDATGRRAAQ